MSKRTSGNQRLTPFERETERRREEMKRNLAGRVVGMTHALLRQYPRGVRKYLLPPRAPSRQVYA